MPAKIVFYLHTKEKNKITYFPGVYCRAALLAAIREISPQIADILHNAGPPRIYAIEPLHPIEGKKEVVNGKWILYPGEIYSMSISILDDKIADLLLQKIRIRRIIIKTAELFEAKPPQIIKTPISMLGRNIRGNKIRLIFRTPTAFRSIFDKLDYVLPTPARIVSSLTKIHNMISEEKICGELAHEAHKHMRVVGFKLTTREIPAEKKIRIGVKGYIDIEIRSREKEIKRLLELSEFSNIGIKRTIGMGVVTIREMNEP